MAVPKITDAKIRSWLSPTYAERGLNYYRNGHVLSYHWSGEKLSGRVQGSEPRPYRVTIRFTDQYPYGDCSCPMGGGCKHVAALLYAAMNEKTSPAARPSSRKKTPSLAAQLKRLDKADLIALIEKLLEHEPELESVVESRLLVLGAATLPPAELRDRVRELVDRLRPSPGYDDDDPYDYEYGYDDEYADAVWDDLDALVEQAGALLDEQRYEAVHNLLSALLSELMLAAGPAGGDDELIDVVEKAAGHLLACWKALAPEDKLRAEALRQAFEVLAWDISVGGSNVQTMIEKALIKSATPNERDVLREWIALAIRQARTGKRDYSTEWAESAWEELDRKLAGRERADKSVKSKANKPRRGR